jgi:hypothetical protein
MQVAHDQNRIERIQWFLLPFVRCIQAIPQQPSLVNIESEASRTQLIRF